MYKLENEILWNLDLIFSHLLKASFQKVSSKHSVKKSRFGMRRRDVLFDFKNYKLQNFYHCTDSLSIVKRG